MGARSAAASAARRASSRPAPGILDVYVRGTDDQLYQKYWTPSTGWSGFIALGGKLTSGLAATAWDGNRRDIFARGADGAIYDKLLDQLGGLGRLGPASAAPPSSGPGATVAPAPGAWRSSPAAASSSLMTNSFASTWTGWQNFGRAPLYQRRRPRPRRARRRAVPGRAAPAGRLRLHPDRRPRAGPRPRLCSAPAA